MVDFEIIGRGAVGASALLALEHGLDVGDRKTASIPSFLFSPVVTSDALYGSPPIRVLDLPFSDLSNLSVRMIGSVSQACRTLLGISLLAIFSFSLPLFAQYLIVVGFNVSSSCCVRATQAVAGSCSSWQDVSVLARRASEVMRQSILHGVLFGNRIHADLLAKGFTS